MFLGGVFHETFFWFKSSILINDFSLLSLLLLKLTFNTLSNILSFP